MKKTITLVLTTIIILSCSNQNKINCINNYDLGIPYILHGNVQKLLIDNIKSVKEPVYFLLKKDNASNYEISLREYKEPFEGIKWIKNTNRFIYLNGNYYPLMFEFDQLFSVQMTTKEFKNSILLDGSYKLNKVFIIDEHPYRVIFNIKGDILRQGYW